MNSIDSKLNRISVYLSDINAICDDLLDGIKKLDKESEDEFTDLTYLMTLKASRMSTIADLIDSAARELEDDLEWKFDK